LQLAQFIRPAAVFLRFDSRDKAAILETMIEAVCATEGVGSHDDVRRSVFEREADRSTGIGRGLAVPHCRSDAVHDFHVSVAVLSEPVEWEALDDQPVRFIFLVVGPADKPETYLQLLSQISRIIRMPEAIKRLLAATTPQQVVDIVAAL
jgi:mannitol/fructose-specific phosphotransferase system IIA component (Ntr-type)